MEGKTLCFTGHRPTQLGGYTGAKAQEIQKNLFEHLARVVIRAADKGFTTFISGGAQGTDQIAAEAVIKCKGTILHQHIKLVIARPFPNQHIKWPQYGQKRFFDIIEKADKVVDVSPGPFTIPKMQIRNEWMVDRSESVVAVWSGQQKGGTWNCIQYAKKMQKYILILKLVTLENNSVVFEEDWLMKGV